MTDRVQGQTCDDIVCQAGIHRGPAVSVVRRKIHTSSVRPRKDLASRLDGQGVNAVQVLDDLRPGSPIVGRSVYRSANVAGKNVAARSGRNRIGRARYRGEVDRDPAPSVIRGAIRAATFRHCEDRATGNAGESTNERID